MRELCPSGPGVVFQVSCHSFDDRHFKRISVQSYSTVRYVLAALATLVYHTMSSSNNPNMPSILYRFLCMTASVSRICFEWGRSSKLTVETAHVVGMLYLGIHVLLLRMIEACVVDVQE